MSCLCILFYRRLTSKFLEHVICYSEEFYKSEFFAMFTTFIMATMPEVKERHLPISIPLKESSCLSLTLNTLVDINVCRADLVRDELRRDECRLK